MNGRNVRTAFVSLVVVLIFNQVVSAQRRRSFFGVARARLATMEKVQTELNMNDEQKIATTEIREKLANDMRALFQDRGGDRTEFRTKMQKMNSEADSNILKKLNIEQQKRLTEIFVQYNGTRALNDKEVGKSLKISDEQKTKLAEVNSQNAIDMSIVRLRSSLVENCTQPAKMERHLCLN